MDLGRIDELIEHLALDRCGITVMPVVAGKPSGVCDSTYQFDGWEIGFINPTTTGPLAAAKTIAEAVEAALYDVADEQETR